MSNKKKNFWWSDGVSIYPNTSQNTTSDGKQVFWGIGDSNSDGTATLITTVSAGILRKWDGNAFVEVTTGTMANGGATGSAWQQFAIDYNSDTGKKIDFLNSGKGGSNLYPSDGSDEHWMGPSAPQGTDLYTPAKAELMEALAADGLTQPKAIMIVGLGVNDFGAGTSLANISSALDALITNITTDFPGVPILYTTTGVRNYTTDLVNNTLYGIRNLQVQKARNTTDLHIVGCGASCVGPDLYEADRIHYNRSGLNHLGSCYARWFKNVSLVTEKWSRSIISSHFDDISLARKNVIKTAVSSLITSGHYWNLEAWFRGKTTIQNNFFLDWTFLGLSNYAGTVTFSANGYIETPGTSNNKYLWTSWDGSAMRAATNTDWIEIVELVSNDSASGANRSLFGYNSGGGRYLEWAFNDTLRYVANDNTATTGAAATTILESDSYHWIARNSGDKIMGRNTTIRNTTAVAETAIGSQQSSIGARSSTTYLAGKYNMVAKAKYVDFDLATFQELNDYISDNW